LQGNKRLNQCVGGRVFYGIIQTLTKAWTKRKIHRMSGKQVQAPP
jgi:hypothetical protein